MKFIWSVNGFQFAFFKTEITVELSNFVGLQSGPDRISSTYSRVWIEFCQATVEFGQNVFGLQSSLDRICRPTVGFGQNFVGLQLSLDRIIWAIVKFGQNFVKLQLDLDRIL